MPTLQELTAELDARDAAIAKKMAAFEGLKAENDELRGRLEDLEAKAKVPGATSPRRNDEESREWRTRFVAWMRKPGSSETKNALGEFESQLRTKAVNISTPADGGFALPEEVARDIEKLEKKFSPVRNLVRVDTVSTNDNKALVSVRGATAGWVGESTARTETGTPQLRERAPSMGELYAYPQCSEWSLDDLMFDVAAWLAEEVAEEFAGLEGEAVIRGDGTNKPTGLLNTTPVATPDFASPLRNAAAYQFIPSLSQSSPAAAEIHGDAIIDLVYALNARYRANGTFVMNSQTQAAVMKLKDGEGRPLWQPSLMAGQPHSLLGYPIATWEQMDDIAPNSFPIGFGDFRRGYRLVDRGQLRITVDHSITTPGRVKFFVRRREGGTVHNNDAIKFLRCTLS